MPNFPTDLSTPLWYTVAVATPRLRPLTYAAPIASPGAAVGVTQSQHVPQGSWCLVPLGTRTLVGLVLSIQNTPPTDLPTEKIRPILRPLQAMPAITAATLRLYEFAAQYYRRPLGAVLATAIPPWLRRASSHMPTKRGNSPMDKLQKVVLSETPCPDPVTHTEPPLTTEQHLALGVIAERLAAPEPGSPVLLHGVTGSGKTRVYIEAIRLLWQHFPGAQVLLMVPEIGLTPQLEARMRAAFPHQAQTSLHSSMPETQRAAAWLRAANGQARLILGTRLAVLTPLPHLRLVIVDEEHDAALKQQEGLRYSARDLAVYRAQQDKALVILGSATPSLESLARCEEGAYRRLRLTHQATGVRRAPVRLVDTLSDPAVEGLTRAARDALARVLATDHQALVFLNRRGWAPILGCEACGWLKACLGCLTPMVLHKASRSWRLICHHCGAQEAPPPQCPDCSAPDIGPLGRGIQRLEAALNASFPEATTLRLDRDAIRSADAMQRAMHRIREGDVQIIVGTQMMAKGHDIERLRLVVVVDADQQLMHPDFRSQEWLLATLVQVAGRAGRHDTPAAPQDAYPAEVLVQTRYPQHPLFRALTEDNVDAYAAQLLNERREAGLPPFGYLAVVRLACPHKDRLTRYADALYGLLTQWLRGLKARAQHDGPDPLWAEAQVYPPAPDYPERQAGRYRWHLVLEAPSRRARAQMASQAEAFYEAQATPLDQQIEIDPLSQI